MDKKRNSKRFEGVILIVLLILSLPLFIGAIWELLQPIVVWVFIGLLVLLGLSIETLFDSNASKLDRVVFLLLSSALMITFLYFMRTAS